MCKRWAALASRAAPVMSCRANNTSWLSVKASRYFCPRFVRFCFGSFYFVFSFFFVSVRLCLFRCVYVRGLFSVFPFVSFFFVFVHFRFVPFRLISAIFVPFRFVSFRMFCVLYLASLDLYWLLLKRHENGLNETKRKETKMNEMKRNKNKTKINATKHKRTETKIISVRFVSLRVFDLFVL